MRENRSSGGNGGLGSGDRVILFSTYRRPLSTRKIIPNVADKKMTIPL